MNNESSAAAFELVRPLFLGVADAVLQDIVSHFWPWCLMRRNENFVLGVADAVLRDILSYHIFGQRRNENFVDFTGVSRRLLIPNVHPIS
jgi:hypothetical protein